MDHVRRKRAMELEELVHPMQHHFPAVDFTSTLSYDYNSVEQEGNAIAAAGFASLSSWQSELGDVCSQTSCSYSFGQEQDVSSFSMFHHHQQQHDSLSSTADNLVEPQFYQHEQLLAMALPQQQQQQQQQLRGYLSSSSAAAGIHRSEVLRAVERDALQWHMLQYQSMPALLQLDIPSASRKTELLEDITAAATTTTTTTTTTLSDESSLTEYPCSKRPRSAGCFTLETVSESVRRHASAGDGPGQPHHQAIVRQLNAGCTPAAATATPATPSPGRMSLKYPSKKQEGSVEPQSVAARQRRKRISERVRELEKLVPGGGKMDTATMLDEAFKFVKFLQIQVQLLESSAAGPNIPAYRKMPFPFYEYSPRTPSSSPSPLVLTETLQHVLFKHRRCIASIPQC